MHNQPDSVLQVGGCRWIVGEQWMLFAKIFNTVSHNIHIDKLTEVGVSGQGDGFKTICVAAPRELWSVTQNLTNGKSLVVYPSSEYWCQYCFRSSYELLNRPGQWDRMQSHEVCRWYKTERSCAAIKRDLNRMMDWAERNYTKFSSGKCQVLHQGRNNPMNPHVWG